MSYRLTNLLPTIFLTLGSVFVMSCSVNPISQVNEFLSKTPKISAPVWKNDLRSEVQALGYRNWIVIADAAYPFHNRAGVRTVVAPVETPEIIRELVATINEKQHIKPQFYTARELKSVKNSQAAGVDQYRKEIKSALSGYTTRELDSVTLNRLLQGTSSTYAVLVIKTQTALPYSSIFIELDSGYWDVETERELRESIRKDGEKPVSKTSDRLSDLAANAS